MQPLQTAVLFLLLLSHTLSTPRVVVTFRNASLNTEATPPENTTIVKQYGRRLVLRATEGVISEDWVREALGGEEYVERVEADAVAAVDETVDAASVAAVSSASLDSIRTGWNLDENEPYGLHIRSIRSLTDGQGATMAIIDSGVAEAAKPVLRPAAGYDFISSPEYSNTPDQNRNPDYTDPGDQGPTCPTPSWHGTKVASVAAAIAPGATLTIMRVLGQCGVGFSSDIADAVVWAAGGWIDGLEANPFPASVISLSLAGKGQCPSYLQSAVNQARSLGATVIAAAGNAAQNVNLYFPANCFGVLAVGASTRQGNMAQYSNWGDGVVFSAPGGGGDATDAITVLSVLNGLLTLSSAVGTSFAAPHVAGFSTLLRVGGMGIESSCEFVPFAENCNSQGSPCSRRGIISTTKTFQPIGIISNASIGSPINNWFTPANRSNPSRVVSAAACTTVRKNTADASRYSGYPNSECDGHPQFACNAGCYITGIFAGNVDNLIKRLKFECSDGSVSYMFGDNYGGYLWRSAYGFSRIYACADNSNDKWLWGLTVYDQSNTQVGTLGKYSGCSEDVDFQCGQDEFGRPRLLVGMNMFIKSSGGIAQIQPICSSIQCPSGYYMGSSAIVCSTCDACPSGNYMYGCGGISSGGCLGCGTDCPNTQYRAGCGGTSSGWCAYCSECGAGQKFGGCEGGGLSDSRTCSACDAGTYGGGGRSRGCASCGAGKYNPDSGSAYESACQACPAGKFNPNTGSNSIAACQSCAAGKNSLTVGATSSDTCVNCAVGKYSPGAGTGVDCTPCAAGSYTNAQGQSQCTPCGAGSYAATSGLTVCTLCGVGKYSAAVGANAISTCLSCAAGTYNVNQGGANYLACTKCEPGKYGLTAAATDCISCTPGKFSTASGRNSVCDNCGTGKYNPDTGGALVSSCANCDPGKYGPSLGLSACPLCLPGTYTGTTGNVACSACSSTTYTTGSGINQCQACTVLTNCALGTEYTCVANTGSVCVPCAIIYACEYLTNRCFSGSDPSCLCAAGFEMVGGKCVGCTTGKYKSTQGNSPCATITTPVCSRGQYLQPGSAYANAACMECPVLPPNAVQAPTGCDWTCSAGYDNNAP